MFYYPIDVLEDSIILFLFVILPFVLLIIYRRDVKIILRTLGQLFAALFSAVWQAITPEVVVEVRHFATALNRPQPYQFTRTFVKYSSTQVSTFASQNGVLLAKQASLTVPHVRKRRLEYYEEDVSFEFSYLKIKNSNFRIL